MRYVQWNLYYLMAFNAHQRHKKDGKIFLLLKMLSDHIRPHRNGQALSPNRCVHKKIINYHISLKRISIKL